MGQINYPKLNRFGYSMHWDQAWSNLNFFFKSFSKFYLADKIIANIFLEKISQSFYFLTKSFFKNNKLLMDFFKEKPTNLTNFKTLMYKKTIFYKLPFYLGKVGFFKFQSWILIKPYIYLPTPQKIISNLSEKNYKINYFVSFFTFKNYYNNYFFKKNYHIKNILKNYNNNF